MLCRSACLAVCGLAVVVSTSAIVGAQPLGNPGTLAEELRLARKAGLPLTPAELRLPVVSAARNAAPFYIQMREATDRNPAWKPDIDLLRGPWEHHATDVPGLKARRAALQRIQPLVQLAHKAASRPGCRFYHDWSQGSYMAMRDLFWVQPAARLLASESLTLSAGGQWARAISNASLAMRIAGHAEADPVLLSHNLGYGARMAGLRALGEVLKAHPDVATARAVQSALAAAPKPPALYPAFGGEAVLGMADIERLRKTGITELQRQFYGRVQRQAPPATARQEPTMDDMAACVVWGQRISAEASRLPYRQFEQRIAVLNADVADRAARKEPQAILASLLLPVYLSVPVNAARDAARWRVIETATQAVLSRSASGAYPTTLGQVPLDPFSGKPLVYRREGKGFVVYSVGETGKFAAGRGAKVGREVLFRME